MCGRADPLEQAAGGEPAQLTVCLESPQQRDRRAEVLEVDALAHVAAASAQRLDGAAGLRSDPPAHARVTGSHARDCLLQRQTVVGHVAHTTSPAALANANLLEGLCRGEQLRHCLSRPLSNHDGRVDGSRVDVFPCRLNREEARAHGALRRRRGQRALALARSTHARHGGVGRGVGWILLSGGGRDDGGGGEG